MNGVYHIKPLSPRTLYLTKPPLSPIILSVSCLMPFLYLPHFHPPISNYPLLFQHPTLLSQQLTLILSQILQKLSQSSSLTGSFLKAPPYSFYGPQTTFITPIPHSLPLPSNFQIPSQQLSHLSLIHTLPILTTFQICHSL